MSAPASPDQDAARTAWDLARDRPDAYLPRDRRWALHAGQALPDRVQGAALFADISGFTPLTEALAHELGPQRGAEELTANIGRVFHAVISELDAYDGNVIYFAGDAITCWIDGDDGTRACAAALAMQEAIARTGTIVTPGGATVQLAMKVAVAVGSARRFVVGDPDIQLIDVLAGRLMDMLAVAEHHAEKGEVVLDQSAVAAIGGQVALGASREDDETERTLRVLDRVLVDVPSAPVVQPDPLPEDLVRAWLLPSVYERMRTGRGEFLAELRPAIPVFLRFGGIDYDRDDDAIGKLDDFVRAAQRVLNGYGGNVLQLTLGDKGAYLYGVFGSPLAHEDDAARAAAAALELRDLEKTTAATGIQIGMTQGRLRSGTYGHDMRRTFVCLGDAVNLAARLMSKAPPGGIYVAGPLREAAGDAFIWERLPDLRVKGKTDLIEAWALNGSLERASRRKTRFELGLVGRREELAALDRQLGVAMDGRGQVVGIAAEAGMGKSRLVAEFVRNARRSGHTVAFGECQSYGTKTPYFVWREIWRRLFGLEDGDPPERQIATIGRRLAAVDPALVGRAPLLSDVVGLSIPDSELTRGFDAKLRKSSLEDLLAACLRARAREAPFVAVLEDCHWIDELSRDLLEVLVRTAATLPVLFVLAYRPSDEPGGGLGVDRHPSFSEMELDRMEPDEVAQLARSKMDQLTGEGAGVSDELVDLVAARADGNPFYVEELLNFFVAQGVDTSDPAAIADIHLPESLHTLVLSRIDAAAEGPRRTMKVASVVGRVFPAPMLAGVYDELGDLDAVIGHLDALRTLDLVALDREADQAWMFKHVVTQEVAYESLPFALRAVLHERVGDYIERTEANDLDRVIPLLEHHYWRSEREDKKLHYLRRAAEAAQAAYANRAAIAYFDRLIPLLDGEERVSESLKLAEVLHLTGDTHRAVRVASEARERAVQLDDASAIARCDHSLAESARRLGRFDQAAELLEAAGAGFEAIGDQAGIADVHHLAGTVANQRGHAASARDSYLRSLAIREQLGDQAGIAKLVTNLGIVATGGGDLEQARAYLERGATIYRELGDRRGSSIAATNLAWASMIGARPDEARRYSEQALALAREIGDRFNTAVGQNNLGNALRLLGEWRAAGEQYAAAIEGYRELDDHWGFAFLLEDVALLAAGSGQAEDAFRLVGAADALRAEIGAPREASLDQDIRTGMDPARAAIDPEAARRATDEGTAMALEASIALALRVCERAGA
jgi:class 3 adenylate cyclase/tetratricopeptide (TPR) repeat protein